MSLRDLKNLAPWQWESKVAQKKHTVGPKGLQDFAEVARALQGDGEGTFCADLKEKQVSSSKRRRGPREVDEATASAISEPSQQKVAAAADATLFAPTPALKNKQRPAADTPAAYLNGSSRSTLATSGSSSGSDDSSSQHCSPLPAAATPAAAATACPTALDSIRQQKRVAAVQLPVSGFQHTTPGTACTPAAPAASRLQHATPCAAGTPGAPSAADLLNDAFSPCALPTPTPYAILRFASSTTPAAPAAANNSSLPGSAVKAAPASSLRPQGSDSSAARLSSLGMQRSDRPAGGTPLPKPQFTPNSMPPPAKRSSLRAATALTPVCAVAPGGSSMKSSPFAAQTPAGMALPRLQPTLSAAAAASPCDASPQRSPEGRLAAFAGDSVDGDGLQETLAGSSSLGSPRDEVQLCLGLGLSSNSPPGPAAAAAANSTLNLTATPAAAGARSSAAAAAACGSARLPAKLRCKTEANGRPAGGDVTADHSSREAAPAAPPAADSQALAALAAAAAASAGEQQQQHSMPACTAGTSSSGCRSISSPGVSAQQGTPGMFAGGSSSRKAGYVTPAGRMGLKRLWCHTHAAAMAAEAAAAGKDCTAAAAAVDASPHGAGVGACRPRSPDSQAVVRSAELLLAAAEMGSPMPAAAAAADDESAMDVEPASMRHSAADDDMQVDPRDSRQQQVQVAAEPTAEAMDATVAPAAAGAAGQLNRQQQGSGMSGQGANAAASAVAQPRPLCDAGTSLLLPPAAQLRLRQQEQRQQQQQPKPQPGTALHQPSGAAGTSTAAPAAVQQAGAQPTSQAAAAAGQATAAQGSCLHIQPCASSRAGSQVTQQGSATAAGLQQQAGQLNQQLAAMGYSSYSPFPGSHISSSAGAGAAMYPAGSVHSGQPRVPACVNVHARMPHVLPSLHAVQCGTRTSHSGVLMHAGLPGVQLSQQQQAITAWTNIRLLMQQQQQAMLAGTSAAAAAGHHQLARNSRTPEPPAITTAAVAAAAGPAGLPEQRQIQQQQQQQVAQAAVVELLPSIQPLAVPGTLSDDEAWQIALTQPWVIQQETARAQQLLAQVGAAAAAAAAAGGMCGRGAAPAARQAAAPAQQRTEDAAASSKAASGAMLPPANRRAPAAVGLYATAAAGHNCQGVRSSVPAPQQKQPLKRVQQQGPSPRAGGVLGGLLCSSNIINTL